MFSWAAWQTDSIQVHSSSHCHQEVTLSLMRFVGLRESGYGKRWAEDCWINRRKENEGRTVETTFDLLCVMGSIFLLRPECRAVPTFPSQAVSIPLSACCTTSHPLATFLSSPPPPLPCSHYFLSYFVSSCPAACSLSASSPLSLSGHLLSLVLLKWFCLPRVHILTVTTLPLMLSSINCFVFWR